MTPVSQLADPFPCFAPFEQLYLVPRKALDFRLCSYHPPQYVPLSELLEGGLETLDRLFETHPALAAERERFLAGDFDGAKCSSGCHSLCRWQTTGQGFTPARDAEGQPQIKLKRLWLSMGPDCNIKCRYCLDPANFQIDYNSCDPRVMNILPAFVRRGGEVLLTGGEPFLPKFKFVDALRQLKGCDSGGRLHVQTNATYLNADVRQIVLDAPFATVNMSLDTLRPELFEYLRRGAKFATVWGNMRALRAERDARGQSNPFLVVLCAVMRDNYDHLLETVNGVAGEGIAISLNALFKGYYSPDFCREQGLHTLSVDELKLLDETISRIREKHGDNGLVGWAGLKGQVDNLLTIKQSAGRDFQVALGDGGEARRKVIPLREKAVA
jgi:sulfatase maturation enzyme AslB (radical SAM superfamily)